MSEEKLSVFPMGEKNDAYARYFVGQSYLKMLTTEGVVIGNVTFEPGCRNNWHIHHQGGQILLVTGGRGYYQEWGKPARYAIHKDGSAGVSTRSAADRASASPALRHTV